MKKRGVIYKIENLVNGKVYVGQTVQKFNRRKSAHLAKLKGNYHINNYLQNAWNKYEKYNFIFKIIEKTEIKYLDKREIYWINYYKKKTGVYNFEGGGNKRKVITEKVKKKLSKVLKESYKKPEILEKRKKQWKEISGEGHFNNKKIICLNDMKVFYSITKAADYYNIDMKNISQVLVGRTKSCFSKNENDNRRLQFEYYKEGKNYSLNKLVRKNCKKVICITTNEVFDSVTEAGKKYDIPTTNISKTCKGKQNHAGRLKDGTQLAWEYA